MEIRIFGQGDGGIPVSLGFKVFNVSNYVSRIRHKMEICLEESPCQRNKLHLQVTIVPLADSKKISDAFLRGQTDETSGQVQQPPL
jgi:DNA gyrase/topoisomerase IV subunit A